MNRVTLALNKDFDFKDVSEVLSSIFSEKRLFAEYKVKYFKDKCDSFEKENKLNTDNFMAKFEKGELGDDKFLFDWYAAKKGLDSWKKKLAIIKGVSISGN